MTLRRAATAALYALFVAAPPAAGQRALGIGGDASTLPRGVARFSAGALWERANERYAADGKLYALGASASATSWNGRYDDRLAAATPLVATLSGVAAFDASLGTLAVGRRDGAADAVFSAAVGVFDRLTVGAQLRAANHAMEPRVTLNPGRVEGTVGFNPAWTNTGARDRNALLLSQFDSAVAQTTRRITQCQASPATAGCSSINANVAGAQALVGSAASFATTLNQLYGGRKNAVGLPFVPLASGVAQSAIVQRVLGYRDQFAAFGNSSIGADGPAAAALFSPADLVTLLSDSLYGYLMRPVRTVHAYGLGEVSLRAKLRVFDMLGSDTAVIAGFAVRQAVAASLRLKGGTAPDPAEPFAPVTGEPGGGVTVQSFTDLFYGRRWSATVSAGIELPSSTDYALRLPSATAPMVGGEGFPLQDASREVRFTLRPASRLDLRITPRVAMTSNILLGASWSLSRQAKNRWNALAEGGRSGTWSVTDLSAWADGTDWTEQRLSLGGTYSTVAASRGGRAKLAFDVSFEHEQTIAGTGWRVAHVSRDVVTVRWYPRMWGRR